MTAREFYGEVRVRFGSIEGGIHVLIGRLLSMIGRYRSAWFSGLLIRRSWVRNPPGSYSVSPAFLPCASPLTLGKFTGNLPPDLYADSKILLVWKLVA